MTKTRIRRAISGIERATPAKGPVARKKAAAADSPGRLQSRPAAGEDPAKRRQILEGANRCFMAMGFEAASMNAITAEAGVSKGTIYVYFADKEELFAAIITEKRNMLLENAAGLLRRAVSVEEALQSFAVALATLITSEEVVRAQRMVLGVAGTQPKLAAGFFGTEQYSGVTVLKDYLEDQVAKGVLAIDDTELAACQFLDLSQAGIFKARLFGRMTKQPTAQTIAARAAAAVEMFLARYRAPQA